MQHIGLGGEKEGKNLFKGLQLYNLSFFNSSQVCVYVKQREREFYYLKAVFLFAHCRRAHVALNTSEFISGIILVKTG